ncbi:MAG TPA: GTPase Era [bacterium]|nr:GTPase Era [bacterium]HQC51429.1 GTPase Era [bacterium]HQG13971.1 GTPase Era [bacterium]HQH79953.1 GTPase Era [bacterium]
MNEEKGFKSGYVAIIGRPNAGKSTLINAILGERLSIVTEKPQTTRHRIRGLLNDAGSQIIFFDTPGYHRSHKPLNEAMNDIVDSVINDADVVCLLIPANHVDEDGIEKGLFERIGSERALIVINKADLVSHAELETKILKYRDAWGAKELMVISALQKIGMGELVEAIKGRLPEGPKYFPDDIFTDHSVRFLVAELIREQLFLQMHQELPYSAAVEIEEFTDATEDDPIFRIKAAIIVEKDSQKGMVIGKGGTRIKEIGSRSREAIEELVGGKVFLQLFVRVEYNWTKDPGSIRKFGYTNQVD